MNQRVAAADPGPPSVHASAGAGRPAVPELLTRLGYPGSFAQQVAGLGLGQGPSAGIMADLAFWKGRRQVPNTCSPSRAAAALSSATSPSRH
jgi:hypothetical protein